MTGHDEHATTVPDERRWEYRPMSALGRYELLYNGRVLAEAWWLHELAYPAVTMTRLVDRLNLPGGRVCPSVAPTWTGLRRRLGGGSLRRRRFRHGRSGSASQRRRTAPRRASREEPMSAPYAPKLDYLCDDPDCCWNGCPDVTCKTCGEEWPCPDYRGPHAQSDSCASAVRRSQGLPRRPRHG